MRSILPAFCLVLFAGSLLPACRHADDGAADDSQPRVEGDTVKFSGPARGIAVAPAEESAEKRVTLPGRLVWNEDQTVRVFSPFAGRVTKIVAQLGDRVEAGQVLAELTSPDFGTAQADYRKARAALSLAEKALARQQDLFAHGVAAEKDLQQAEADHATAAAEVQRTEALVKMFGDDGDAVSQRFRLKSPIAGLVVERNLNPGQELRPDQSAAPLFVITDPSDLWVQLDGHEGDLRELHPGQMVTLSTSQYPGESFQGVVERLADFVDPATRAVKVRGRVPNPDRRLKGEMYVSAEIALPAQRQTVVPVGAVFLRGDAQYVFVAGGGSAYTRRHVETGPELQGLVPVLNGVQPGEQVVKEGGLYLDRLLDAARS